MNKAESSQPYTLSFKVTGLDAASRYTYVLSVLDENNIPLHVYIGDFATTGYTGDLRYDGNEVIPTPPIIPGNPNIQETTTGIENARNNEDQNNDGIVLIQGRIVIRRDGKIYSITGQKIL